MKICNQFYYASSITDALQALGQAAGSARVLAGGTDLLLDIQQDRHAPVETLVDITRIPELNCIELRQQELYIGAAVPHHTITNHPLVQSHATSLAEASGLIGGPQVRNVATLGGNVAHALPAADGTIALMTLDAHAEVASLQGRRTVPLVELFSGPGVSTLDPQKELLVGFHLPLRQNGQGSAFKRIMRPQGVAIAILNCSVWLQRDRENIADIHISIGPCGPTPRRLPAAEACLRGQQPQDNVIQSAHTQLLQEVSFRTSRHRATQAYREQMAGVLLQDALLTAWERSKI